MVTLLEQINKKVDRIETKLDKYMELSIETKTLTDNNKAMIRIIVASLLSAIMGTIIYVVKFLIKI